MTVLDATNLTVHLDITLLHFQEDIYVSPMTATPVIRFCQRKCFPQKFEQQRIHPSIISASFRTLEAGAVPLKAEVDPHAPLGSCTCPVCDAFGTRME